MGPDDKSEKFNASAAAEQRPIAKPPGAAPIISPPVVHEFHERPGRRWPTALGYLLAALIVAIIVVYLARWIYHKVSPANKPSSSPASNVGGNPPPPQPATPSQAPAASGQSPSSASSSGLSANTGQTGQPSTGQYGVSGQLPNSGPGDVVAIFVGVSLIFGGLHYLVSLRRHAHSNTKP